MAYIEIYWGGGVQLHEKLPESVRATVLGISQRFWEQSRLYGPDGAVWRPSPADPGYSQLSTVQRLLAHSVYNPWRAVPMRYERAGECQLAELKARIRDCVDRDDDVLTQFMEADELKAELERAIDFESVVTLLRRVQQEEDAAEQPVREA